MEEILFIQPQPDPMMVKTDSDLYMVYPNGEVTQWVAKQDEFMKIVYWELDDGFIRTLRFTSFPNLFPST